MEKKKRPRGSKPQYQYEGNFDFKHINPGEKICDMECISLRTNTINWKLNNPFAIRCLVNQHYTDDPYLALPKLKFELQDRITKTKTYQQTRQNRGKCSISDTYEKIQKLLNKDPDKYFSSNYNWYYTGGNLASHTLDKFLILYYSSDKSNLNILKLSLNDSKWKVKRNQLLCSCNDTIYQICTSDNNNIIGARTKYAVSLNTATESEDGDFKNTELTSTKHDIPFVNLNLNNIDVNEYMTIDASQCVAFRDINTNEIKSETVIPNSTNLCGNHFAESVYLNNNVVACINRTGFFLYDKRFGEISSTNFVLFEENELCMGEVDLSTVCVGMSDSVKCFITTTKNVKCLDIRVQRIINTWSHKMEDVPFLSEYVYCNGIDTVSISSSVPSQKLLLSDDSKTNIIPMLYPNLRNAYEMSILSNHYQRDISHLTVDRLAARTTGITIIPTANDQFTMFASNSLGDLFAYPVNNSYEEYNFTPTKYNWSHEPQSTEVLYIVDRVCLDSLDYDTSNNPAVDKNVENKKLNKCLKNLEEQRYYAGEFISSKWYDTERENKNVLDNITNVDTNENVERWLTETPNIDIKSE